MTSHNTVTLYAQEAATRLWRRTLYINNVRMPFAELFDFDEFINANIDGVIEFGSDGLQTAWTCYENSRRVNASDQHADCLVGLISALHTGDFATFDRMIDGVPHENIEKVLVESFIHAPTPCTSEKIYVFLNSKDIQKRNAALSVLSDHQLEAGEKLKGLLINCSEIDGPVMLNAVGFSGRTDLIPLIAPILIDQSINFELKYRAAKCLLFLGERQLCLDTLQIACGTEPNTQEALKLWCLSMPLGVIKNYVKHAFEVGKPTCLHIRAIGWSGDVKSIPFLIDLMENLDICRVCGESFRLILGVDLKYIEAVKEDSFDSHSSDSEADNFPVPNKQKVQAWWDSHKHEYQSYDRLFLGHPITENWLLAVLLYGEQYHRELAALHLKLVRPESKLFSVRSNSAMQTVQLRDWNRK